MSLVLWSLFGCFLGALPSPEGVLMVRLSGKVVAEMIMAEMD